MSYPKGWVFISLTFIKHPCFLDFVQSRGCDLSVARRFCQSAEINQQCLIAEWFHVIPFPNNGQHHCFLGNELDSLKFVQTLYTWKFWCDQTQETWSTYVRCSTIITVLFIGVQNIRAEHWNQFHTVFYISQMSLPTKCRQNPLHKALLPHSPERMR